EFLHIDLCGNLPDPAFGSCRYSRSGIQNPFPLISLITGGSKEDCFRISKSTRNLKAPPVNEAQPSPGDDPLPPVYDAIVVGSGAAGGIAAYVLATKGLKVLCLEAGRMLDPATDFYTHKFPYEWPLRGQGKPGQYGKLPQGMEWKI